MNASKISQVPDTPGDEAHEPLHPSAGECLEDRKKIAQSLAEFDIITGDQVDSFLSAYAQGSIAGVTFPEYVAGVVAQRLGLDQLDQAMLLPFTKGEESIESVLERIKNPGEEVEDVPTIPGFHFIKKLGQGGQGAVYLAEQKQGIIHRKVAVKIFKNVGSGQYFSRMKREVNAPGSLPNNITGRIVITYDAQPLPDGSGYYSVMEYVEGGESLGEVEKGTKPPLAAEAVWDIAQNLLETLQAFEEEGVAHRDIKPANILVSGSMVKIADFGLVKMGGHDESFATEEGTILGTMAYLDPDSAKDARFDVYSLGMTVRCLLTGKPPFSDEPTRTLFYAHRSFSHKMGEFSQSKKTKWSASATLSSPEWVQQLRKPGTDCEKALAYLCERASLPVAKRPMPSALLTELSEKFPDLMGDEKSRVRVGSIRMSTRRNMLRMVGAAATLGLAGVAGLYVSSRGEGDGKEGSMQVVTANGNEGKEKIEQSPIEAREKFAEMNEEEKQAFIEKIAVNAVGAPVPVDEVRFALEGLQNKDGSPVIIGNPENSVINKIEINGETVIVGATALNQSPEHLAEILGQFKRHGIEIERDGISPEEVADLGIDVHSNDGKMATSYQDPNWRIVCFIRRGNNIVVTLSYSFAAMNIQAGNESVQRVYPWLKDKPDMEEIPGSQSLPLSTLLVGLNGPKIMAPTENFPAEGPLKRFTKSINAILRHRWTSMGAGIEP